MGGSAALLAVLSVIGYGLLRHCCHHTGFRWQALEWQQNLFESTAVGVFFFGMSRVVAELVGPAPGDISFFSHRGLRLLTFPAPLPHWGAMILAALIGGFVAACVNAWLPRDAALLLAVRNHGGSLRQLMHESQRADKPVMVSLRNRKVYVGWVMTPPTLAERSHVVLLPTLSGFRSSTDLQVQWTTDYSPAYAEIDTQESERASDRSQGVAGDERDASKGAPDDLETTLDDFQLVVPLDSIETATNFDRGIYDRHFARGTRPPQESA